jgi:hypothetical protein
MAKTVYATYESDNIEIDFTASYGRFEDIPPDIQVLSLHILGVKVSLLSLPKGLQSAILSLALETL